MKNFDFHIVKEDASGARTGVITTPHGTIDTPAFVPVGTQATIKSLTPEEIKQLNVELFFVNTYHMAMRPGIETIIKAGGLHRFMNCDGPIITDSGGFQVFSLAQASFVPRDADVSEGAAANFVKITEDGVEFRSHWDGSKHFFTPEHSMKLQWQLGSDIHIAFDDCPPFPITYDKAKTSLERTHRWASRSLNAHQSHAAQQTPYQALYGIIQGSVYEDLRTESARFISSRAFDGIAIGGVAVGESKADMRQVCDWVIPHLPREKPRHLLGVGEIDDIFDIVARGIDTFDCVQPTRLARMGQLYTMSNVQYPISNKNFTFDITKKIFAQDFGPVDSNCTCYTCTHFTRAYLHHLFRVKELLAYRLASMHNIWWVTQLLANIRMHINQGTFTQFRQQFLFQ